MIQPVTYIAVQIINMSMRNIIDEIKNEIQREQKLFSFLNIRKARLPQGSLVINHYRNDTYYYQQIYDHGRRECLYLDPDIDEHAQTITDLMEKKTLTHAFPIIRDNLEAMERFLKMVRVYHPSDHKYGNLLGPEYYLEGDVCIREWKKKEESQNPFLRQNLVHETKRGINVRSKSEVLISDTLSDAKLLLKYEPTLKLCDGGIVYPDFEILHPKTNELIWWEHLGKADDGDYMQDNIEKLAAYGRAGIIHGKNLIVTSETGSSPLTRGTVLSYMKKYQLI